MAAPIAAISANDTASEIHPNLRTAHHSAVLSVANAMKVVPEIMRPIVKHLLTGRFRFVDPDGECNGDFTTTDRHDAIMRPSHDR